MSDGGVFPLRLAPTGRSFVDASGRPFLLHGEAAWSMVVELDGGQLGTYLTDRQSRGVNTLLVSLVEHRFSSRAPATIDGIAPFTTPGNMSTPNPAYFDWAEQVVTAAERHGMLIVFTFAYLGYGGGNEGWYQELIALTPAQRRDFGRLVGQRFRAHPNILYAAGGDYEPADKNVVRNLVDGVKDFDTTHLFTFHGSRGVEPLVFWAGDTWIDVNNIYVGANVAGLASSAFTSSTKPFFLIEGYYENENSSTRQSLRAEGFITMSFGGAGRITGNSPLWCFGRTNCFAPTGPPTWPAQLNSPGSRDMQAFKAIYDTLPWYELAPSSALISAGTGYGARTSNGRLATVYLPSGGSVTVALGQLTVPTTPSWIDPSSGARQSAGAVQPASGTHVFTAPGMNAASGTDWLLLLDGR